MLTLQNNCGQAGGQKGLDVNVVPAWQQGYSGRNISVCILDDGIEHTNDDLRDNYVSNTPDIACRQHTV